MIISNLRKILILLVIVVLSGCKIIIQVPEGGQVVSRTDENNCSSGQECVIDVINGDIFSDTFTAIPDTGYVFAGWKKDDKHLCGGSTAPCALENVPGVLTEYDVDLLLVPIFEEDPNAVLDFDNDGILDTEDSDDDNDGVGDLADSCPLGELNWVSDQDSDNDSDGCRDESEDADDDNDGVNDEADDFPLDSTETLDSDSDTIGNNSDNCIDTENTDQLDTDLDGQGDACDSDDDGDGIEDSVDLFPLTPWTEEVCDQIDNDQDGEIDENVCEDGSESVHYPLDADILDTGSLFAGAGSNDIIFTNDGDRSFLTIDGDDLVTLPITLNEEIYFKSSFSLSFDFRIPDVTPSRYQMLVSSRKVDDEAGAGFVFRVHHEPWGAELIFNYGDGQGSDTYQWLGFSDAAKPGEWHSVSISFLMSLQKFRLTVDGSEYIVSPPNGFSAELFLSEIQTSTITLGGIDGRKTHYKDSFDIDELSFVSPVPSYAPIINTAYTALTRDMQGISTLTELEREAYATAIIENLQFTEYELFKDKINEFIDAYESLKPPLYEDLVQLTFEELPVHDRVLQFSQGYIFETLFVSGNIEILEGMIFEHHIVAPGAVADDTTRVEGAEVEVNGTYNRDIAAMRTDQSKVLRPTGYYLASGDIVDVSVPEEAVGQGLSIVVGHHIRNLDYDYIGVINRFPDISVEYPLDATEIKLANPFGGGIYLKVPEGTNVGRFSMTIDNAVQSPFFSWKESFKTSVSDWLSVAASSGAPWADFESDKFMFTVPTNQLAGVERPDLIMSRWDEIMDAINLVGGRPFDRPRAEYYSFDTRLVDPAYGAQYPLIIPVWEAYRGMPEEGWDPLQILQYPPHTILMHEMGHNELHPTMGYGGNLDQCHFLEAESINHMLGMSVLGNVYGYSIEDAFKFSGVGFPMTFNQAAFDWIVTSNFRNNLRMYEDIDAQLDDNNQLHYQPRSWAKYGDIARLFGWSGLSSVNAVFYSAGVEQQSTVCDWRPFIVGRDEYIRKASEALGFNMTPLFHFWGINPNEETISTMRQYPESQKVYDLIVSYREEVAPKTLEDYMIYYNLFNQDDYQWPRYELYLQEFDDAFAAAIDAQFQFLLDLYFPSGRPE